MEQRAIIKNQVLEWKAVWIIATVILLFGLILNKSFYYICLYFYIVGLILYIYGHLQYAEIDAKGIRLQVGFLFKISFIQIDWNSVERISTMKIKKEFRTLLKGVTFGSGPTPTVFDFDDDEAIEIEIKHPLSKDDQKKIIITNKFLLKNRIELLESGKIIRLLECPDIGYAKFYEKVEAFRMGHPENVLDDGKIHRVLDKVINILLFLLPFVLLIFFIR